VIELDHVLVAVDDLESEAFETPLLKSRPGGLHPDWGTGNRIVPLGDSYFELVAVVDEAKARTDPFGRWVLSAQHGDLLGWAVRGDIESISSRLKLPISSGSRRTEDGSVLRWRFAGIEQAAAEPCLPFFIEWEPGMRLPGEGGKTQLARLRLQGDAERIAWWLGEHDLPIEVTPGPPKVAGFEVRRYSVATRRD
jgi:Glyoxalase-like domain